MEETIIKEKGDRDIATIKELHLKSCKSSTISGLTDEWKNLEVLDMKDVGLTTLKGFPRLANLKKLDLSENNISEGLDALACLPKLQELHLSSNKIKDMDVLEPLSQISTLKVLNLNGCDICASTSYQEVLKKMVASLEEVDGKKVTKEEKNGVASSAAGAGKDEEEEEEEVDDEDLDDSLSEGDDDSLGDEEIDDEEEDEEDIPLEAIYGKINEEGDEDEDDDFVAGEDDEVVELDDEDEEIEEDAADDGRGTKRKCEDEH